MLNITDIMETITMIQEENLDIRSVSAPILDFDNHLIGAISTIGTTRKFSKDALPAIIEKIKKM